MQALLPLVAELLLYWHASIHACVILIVCLLISDLVHMNCVRLHKGGDWGTFLCKHYPYA